LLQQQQNNKRKEKHHPHRIYIREEAQLHNPGAGRNKTSTTGNQWDDKNRPSPRRLGEDQRQGGRREASPHRRSKLQSLSLRKVLETGRERDIGKLSCTFLDNSWLQDKFYSVLNHNQRKETAENMQLNISFY
jgi:hypothetical protein